MKRPLVSVCIPSYNSASFLGDCLESILIQSIEDYEIIISDNCSSDNTKEVIEQFGDRRIRYYQQSENIGSRKNLNFVIGLAEGEFVKTFCADDVMLQGLLVDQLTILKAYPHVSLVTCNHVTSDAGLNPLTVTKMEFGIGLGINAVTRSVNYLDNRIGGPSNFMWRKVDAEGICYDSNFAYLSDFNFAAEILRNGYLANTNTPGYLYRRHSNSDTNQNCFTEVQTLEWAKMYLRWNGENYYAAKELLNAVDDFEIEGKLKSLMKTSCGFRSRLKREVLWCLIKLIGENWRGLLPR